MDTCPLNDLDALILQWAMRGKSRVAQICSCQTFTELKNAGTFMMDLLPNRLNNLVFFRMAYKRLVDAVCKAF